MIKKISIMMCVITVFFAQAISVYAAAGVKLTGAYENSPAENIFRIQGNDQEFVLLDTSDEYDSKYFVMALRPYGNRPFDTKGSQRFDPNSTTNIAYFLNNDFLNTGNREVFFNKWYALPEKIVKYVDFNHSWMVEKGKTIPEPYYVKCGLALLSQTELVQYMDKIGICDDIVNQTYGIRKSGWWLRTPADTGEMLCVRSGENKTEVLRWGTSDGIPCIRPVFWLNKEFFADVPIDLKTAGENVRAVFKKNYTIGELKNIYPVSEIYDYLDYTPTVKLDEVKLIIGDEGNSEYLKSGMVTAEITLEANANTDGLALMGLYSANNACKGIVSSPIHLAESERTKAVLKMDCSMIEKGDYLKISFIDKNIPLETISNSIRIYQ